MSFDPSMRIKHPAGRVFLLAVFVLLVGASVQAGSKEYVPVEVAPGLWRSPYLQSMGPDSVLVVWEPSAPGAAFLDYGRDTSYGHTVIPRTDGKRRVATLRGLQPATPYFYRVRTDERVLAEGPAYRFRTDEGPGDREYTFFVTGDVGSRKGKQRTTAESILRAEPRPEFGLICGDVVYKTGKSKDYDRHLMHPWKDLLATMPIWPALGNHDWKSDPDLNFREEWYLPHNEHYYSFDHGNAHFIALDTRDGDLYDRENQTAWLRSDLETHRGADWTFAFYHHPGITCTYKGYQQEVIESFHPLFDEFAVDVVFMGHAHTYERLYPLRGGRTLHMDQDPNYTDPEGTIYVVTGAGSKYKKNKPTQFCGPTAFFKDETVLWTQVSIEGPRCTIRSFKSDTDELIDEVTITKTSLVQNGVVESR